MKKYLFMSVLVFITFQISYAQNNIELTDTTQLKQYLALSEEQYELIKNKIVKINAILWEDKKIISEIKIRVENGDEPGFFEKIKVKMGRDNRADQIEDLIKEIEDNLTSGQKDKYKNIEKPHLKPLQKSEIFGEKG